MTNIQDILRKNKASLHLQYGVSRVGLFGSLVRGEATRSSDVDILVEFDRNISLFDFIQLEDDLRQLLGRKVDLVEKDALKPIIGQYILKEVVYI